MNTKVNALVTLTLVTVCFLLSIMINKIGDAITLAGATINPVLGFIIPVIFHWKVHQEKPLLSWEKGLSLASAIVIILVSLMSLGQFIYQKVHDDQ
jgi:amino acid permease